MDGFAVRSADCSAAGAKLKIVGLRQAGENQDITLNSGEALRINTGAMLPKGADAVARIEDCTVSNDGADVSIDVAIVAGKHVAPRGSDYASGALLFPKPLEINAARLAALATAGVSDVDVYRQAEVAILTTGNETVSIGAPRAAGQIVDSNGPMRHPPDEVAILAGVHLRNGYSVGLPERIPLFAHRLLPAAAQSWASPEVENHQIMIAIRRH